MASKPTATMHNREQFMAWWMNAYGGTSRNAWRCWSVECLANLTRDISKTMPPHEELVAAGLVEDR